MIIDDYLIHFVVLQLHREFCRAGSDIAQAFTFYASEDKLENRGNEAGKIGVRFDHTNPDFLLRGFFWQKIKGQNFALVKIVS